MRDRRMVVVGLGRVEGYVRGYWLGWHVVVVWTVCFEKTVGGATGAREDGRGLGGHIQEFGVGVTRACMCAGIKLSKKINRKS